MENSKLNENVVLSSSILIETKSKTNKNATVKKTEESYHECYY